MEYVDIDGIEERHFEDFCEFMGRSDENLWAKLFDALYEWDADYLVSDPEGCLEAYLARGNGK